MSTRIMACLSIGTLLMLLSSAGGAGAAVVTVDGTVEHQTIEGFGGAMESHDEYADNQQFWDLLFYDLGVSAINIGGPGNADYATVGQWWKDENFPMVEEARNHGVKTFVLIPTPQPAWKEGPNGEPGVLAGGTLKPEHYDDYAYYMLGYIDFIKSNTGADAGYILPFPEPNWTGVYDPSGVWPYCYMTQSDYRDFMKVCGPIFQSAGSNVKLSAPCGNRVPVTVSYANAILSDPLAEPYVDALVTNGYEWPYATNPTSWQNLEALAQTYGKTGTWVAEVSHWWQDGQMPAPHPSGKYTAEWLHEAVVYGGVSHYYWICMLDFGQYRFYPGLIQSSGFPPGEHPSTALTKQGHAFKQFAHWVRPGAIRVEATSDDVSVMVSSYKHPVQNTFTIVVINDDASVDKTVTFNLNGISASSLQAYRTSATEDSVDLGSVAVAGGTFTYVLPRESTTTFFSGTLNLPPRASAAATPTTGSPPLAVSFDASASYDPDGDSLAFAWDFGDSTTGTGSTVAHSYLSAGTYWAELTVDDGHGETSVDRVQIVVTGVDNDQDGYPTPQDCDDDDPSIHPGAQETCDDSVDNDCDGDTDCNDADCYGVGNCSTLSCQALAVLFHLDNDPAQGETTSLAHDFSGNGHDGAISNATFDPAGMFGGCYEFDGATTDINLGSAQSLDDLEPYTLSLWIKPRSTAGYLVAKENSGAAGSWRLGFEANASLMWYKVTAGGIMTVKTSDGSVQSGFWQHVVLSWDGTTSASGVHIYIDGVEASYQTLTDGSGTVQSDGAYDLHLGYRTAVPEIFDGWMDEVSIWSREFSSQEVADLYALGGPLPCPAAGCSSDADCGDGDVCNGLESCQGGACVPGTVLDCDDGNVCTSDSCDPVLGCQNNANDLPCSDGDDCTMNDRCSQGVCAGEPSDLDGDGHVVGDCGGDDCDDSDAGVHPGAQEICDDGIDQDCDGSDEICPGTGGGCGCGSGGAPRDILIFLVPVFGLAIRTSRRRPC